MPASKEARKSLSLLLSFDGSRNYFFCNHVLAYGKRKVLKPINCFIGRHHRPVPCETCNRSTKLLNARKLSSTVLSDRLVPVFFML